MIRYFLIFILLKSILFGCSLCSIYTPRTHVSTQIKADKEYIKTLKINWVFANEFTKELLQIYDKNLDSSFDEKELALIQTALIDYLKPKNFITSISYDKQINEKSNASKHINSFLENNDLYIFTNENVIKNGNSILCEWYNTQLVNSESKEELEVISSIIDITQRVENEKILNQLANYDALTNLPNRAYFETVLERNYSLSKRNNTILGLAFIDLDGFKAINDTYGHHVGDFLLQEISKRFQNNIRKEDVIARIGGDEFALAFYISNENENYENFLNKLLYVISTPIKYTDTINLKVSASIGVSFYSSKNKVSIKELIKQADNAMYKVKKEGKNSFFVYINNQ
mgnify:CR=1 FL=1